MRPVIRMFALTTLLAAMAAPGHARSGAAAAAAPNPCANPDFVGTSSGEVLYGTEGPDVIDGGGGRDSIYGLGGDDILCGGEGDDRLYGGDGNDQLHGGEGARFEYAGEVRYNGDLLSGDAGDDLLDPGADADSSQSSDLLIFERSASGVTVDLALGRAEGEGHDTIVGPFWIVTGSAYADTLLGSDRDELLTGGLGADRISGHGGEDVIVTGENISADFSAVRDVASGGAGPDEIFGSAGEDMLRGGAGADRLHPLRDDSAVGGPGRDVFWVLTTHRADQRISGGPGHDVVRSWSVREADPDASRPRADGTIDLVTGRAEFRGADFVAKARVRSIEDLTTPVARSMLVLGTANDDILRAGSVAELRGGPGHDVLVGSRSRDVLDGGPGYDRAKGRGGDDVYIAVEKRVDRAMGSARTLS